MAITWLALLSTVPMIFAEEAANMPKALRGGEQDAEVRNMDGFPEEKPFQRQRRGVDCILSIALSPHSSGRIFVSSNVLIAACVGLANY